MATTILLFFIMNITLILFVHMSNTSTFSLFLLYAFNPYTSLDPESLFLSQIIDLNLHS